MSLAASKFPLIRSCNLIKNYLLSGVEVHALQGIDLEIDQGEMVAIMGASGSGKSTLMNIIGCMDKQTNGGARYLALTIKICLATDDLDGRRRLIERKRSRPVTQEYGSRWYSVDHII